MKKIATLLTMCFFSVLFIISNVQAVVPEATIIDHTYTPIEQIPESAILNAKQNLHIAYGHTSHGSQLTTGMSALVGFMNNLGYPQNLYAYNSGGSGGALDLRDSPFSGASDLGNPNRSAWATATRNYLDANPDINVIIWSWCGQVSGSESDIDLYLDLMNTLEGEYPDVRFVYMTGHLDGSGETGTVHQRNEQIRDYCMLNGKTLFDFADIESYDPDGQINYMSLMANDNCDYDSDGNGSRDSNWAQEWQNSHVEDVEWYSCTSAHSQPLNANQKAYAAWNLWARIAGWDGGAVEEDYEAPSVPEILSIEAISATQIDLSWSASTDNIRVAGYRIYRDGNLITAVSSGYTEYQDTDLEPSTLYTYRVSAFDSSGNESGLSDSASATTLETSQETFTIKLEGIDAIDDAFLLSRCPDTNFGTTKYTSGPYDFIIKFNLPSEILFKNIIEAKAYFYVYSQSGYAEDQYLNFYKVNSDWAENTVTWNNSVNNYDSSATVAQVLHPSGSPSHEYYPPADITEQVQRWADGIDENYGLRLKNEGQTFIHLKASEYSVGPYIEITYSEIEENNMDINGDGTVDVLDIMACINVVLGTETSPDIVAAADVNNDGSVSIIDVMEIIDTILG
ncbi:exported hypothetical protein [Desulfamplus magnetovallimortis]|uniref:Uncharacterized protein n=1 Tax=Desulfamplus magnetovallimortis TaxID=1246637 RepID=A0A1W1HAK8_9BACT|nr:DNRLRE domain-containing protein [Desulfamplus magnetovallimortis]SLM29521.1 exported hypothetical protein [Desulfamplus magnetovallimortis]